MQRLISLNLSFPLGKIICHIETYRKDKSKLYKKTFKKYRQSTVNRGKIILRM